MPPDDRTSAAERFRELEDELAALRTSAKSLQEQRPSWFENLFHPGRHARRQADFSVAVVGMLKKITASLRNATAALAEREREISELKNEMARLGEDHERSGREAAGTLQNLTARAAEMREQIGRLEQLALEQSEKIEQLAREQGSRIEQLAGDRENLGNELRERIQHVLDEQRVAIRQLSLKASEDAVLSDRARRATELKLDELTKRLPPPPA